MSRLIAFLPMILIMTACTSAEQKPEKRWDVKVSKQTEPKVWVFKGDGSKQCGQAPASLTPELAMQNLKSMSIMVFEARNGNDGMMRTAVCGADTGNTVELEIFRSDLPKVQAQGYKLMKTPVQN